MQTTQTEKKKKYKVHNMVCDSCIERVIEHSKNSLRITNKMEDVSMIKMGIHVDH